MALGMCKLRFARCQGGQLSVVGYGSGVGRRRGGCSAGFGSFRVSRDMVIFEVMVLCCCW